MSLRGIKLRAAVYVSVRKLFRAHPHAVMREFDDVQPVKYDAPGLDRVLYASLHSR